MIMKLITEYFILSEHQLINLNFKKLLKKKFELQRSNGNMVFLTGVKMKLDLIEICVICNLYNFYPFYFVKPNFTINA